MYSYKSKVVIRNQKKDIEKKEIEEIEKKIEENQIN